MQELVDYTVDRVLHLGYSTAMDRAEAVLAKAQRAKEKKEKGERELANVGHKLKHEIVEVFAATRRNQQREQKGMQSADVDSKWAARFRVEEERRRRPRGRPRPTTRSA